MSFSLVCCETSKGGESAALDKLGSLSGVKFAKLVAKDEEENLLELEQSTAVTSVVFLVCCNTNDELRATLEASDLNVSKVEDVSEDVVQLNLSGATEDAKSKVEEALQKIDGVRFVSMTSDSEVVILCDKSNGQSSGQSRSEEFVESLELLGYDVEEKLQVVELAVEGMMCQNNCGTTVTNALKAVPNVKKVYVSFAEKRAVVKGTRLDVSELVDAVEMVGFDAEEKLELIGLHVEGMMCQNNCGTTVHNALKSVHGVQNVVVSFANKAATIKGKGLDIEELIEAVEMVGFDAKEALEEVSLSVQGMMCQNNCASKVEKALLSLPGVQKAVVSCADKNALVIGKGLQSAQLIEAVERAGFTASDEDNFVQPAKPVITTSTEFSPEETIIEMDKPPLHEIELKDLGSDDLADVDSIEVGIKGMSCAACVANVENHVGKAHGILEVRVALVAEKAIIKFEPRFISGEDVIARINSLGYKATRLDPSEGSVMYLQVEPINADEQHRLLKRLLDEDGVGITEFLDCKLKICFDPHTVGPRTLMSIINAEGYDCVLADAKTDTEEEVDASGAYRRSFLGSLIFTVPVVVISMIFPRIPALDRLTRTEVIPGLQLEALLLWVLTSVVQFGFGWRFYVNAVNALRHGAANMDVLVVLGTTSAYAYSLMSLLLGIAEADGSKVNEMEEANRDAHFFETSAMLITFILLGKYLESSARAKTAGAITALMGLQSPTAVLCKDDATEEIDLRLVQIGDILKVLPGARVPVDGEVVQGTSKVDESMLTGESLPVSKTVGSKLIGSTVNGHGMLLMKATHVGGETALAQIVKLVEEAQTSKAPIQAMADKIARYFVPFVVAIALATWLVWFTIVFAGKTPPHYLAHSGAADEFVFAFKFGVAVLVISCPCALGLATPTAVMVATGVGAKRGILIKGGEALEMGQKVTAVIFDKTGTLTLGKPTVSAYKIVRGSFGRFFSLVGSAELGSEHPLGAAIVNYVKEHDECEFRGEPTGFKAIAGAGLSCNVQGVEVLVGNRRLMSDNNVPVDLDVLHWMEEHERQGASAVLVAFDSKLAGCVAIADTVKETASWAIHVLHQMGIDVWMVTGDHVTTAVAIADKIGLPESRVMAGVLPQHKAQKVEELQRSGAVVAMVGDGINDSPALARADVGIAIGAGTDVALECADVVLIKNEPLDVATVIDLSVKTLRRIKLNFVFSFGYNMLGIPLAAGILYPALMIRLPPPVAGLMMAMSSVSVVCSSLLLRYYKPSFSEKPPDYDHQLYNSSMQRRRTDSDIMYNGLPLLSGSQLPVVRGESVSIRVTHCFCLSSCICLSYIVLLVFIGLFGQPFSFLVRDAAASPNEYLTKATDRAFLTGSLTGDAVMLKITPLDENREACHHALTYEQISSLDYQPRLIMVSEDMQLFGVFSCAGQNPDSIELMFDVDTASMKDEFLLNLEWQRRVPIQADVPGCECIMGGTDANSVRIMGTKSIVLGNHSSVARNRDVDKSSIKYYSLSSSEENSLVWLGAPEDAPAKAEPLLHRYTEGDSLEGLVQVKAIDLPRSTADRPLISSLTVTHTLQFSVSKFEGVEKALLADLYILRHEVSYFQHVWCQLEQQQNDVTLSCSLVLLPFQGEYHLIGRLGDLTFSFTTLAS